MNATSSATMSPADRPHTFVPGAARADAQDVALDFLHRLAGGDSHGAFGLLAPHAEVDILPVGLKKLASDGGLRFFESLVQAFPDLFIQVTSLMGHGETAVIELKMQGTQAADFLGIHNQEKHIDLDQAWLFEVRGGRIERVRAYWCQNQLYRRLGVKRLDAISITG